MGETITTPLTIAQNVGFGGLGFLAIIMALWIVMRLLSAFKIGNGGPNGGGLKGSKIDCPLARGHRTIDDLYEVGVRTHDAVERLADTQDRLNAKIDAFMLELAKGGALRDLP